jgi:hypothetical protein
MTLGLFALVGAVLLPTSKAMGVATSGALADGVPLLGAGDVAGSLVLFGVGGAAVLLGVALTLARMA